MANSDNHNVQGDLERLISNCPSSLYQPSDFFVAWQGVITLAYSGIPPPFVEFKRQIRNLYPFLKQENPGSLWPKTTLGCLKDNKRLSVEDLASLKSICRQFEAELKSIPPIRVQRLSTVIYEKCSLERILMRTDVQLSSELNFESPDESQKKLTGAVLSEFSEDNLQKYWFYASKDGNRTSHYRGSALGTTLVHFLESIPEIISRFRKRVDEVLPGFYDWFEDSSLHITLRALN